MNAIDGIMKSFPEMMMNFPFWKYMPPRWSSSFRRAEDFNNTASDFVKEKIGEAVKKFQEKIHLDPDDMSVMEKLARRNGPDSNLTHVMAVDMVNAGIDTTGNTLAFLVYNLARNPDKQEKLRQEVQSFGSRNLTVADIGKMKYFRACLNESFRLSPTIPYLGRILPQDLVIRGHVIPAKTFIMWSTMILGKDPRVYGDPENFRPERWLEDKDKIHPFAIRQFGHGPRMCIGRRFAELELQLAISKLLTRFEMEWVGREEVEPMTELINKPDKPIPIKFKDLQN